MVVIFLLLNIINQIKFNKYNVWCSIITINIKIQYFYKCEQ